MLRCIRSPSLPVHNVWAALELGVKHGSPEATSTPLPARPQSSRFPPRCCSVKKKNPLSVTFTQAWCGWKYSTVTAGEHGHMCAVTVVMQTSADGRKSGSNESQIRTRSERFYLVMNKAYLRLQNYPLPSFPAFFCASWLQAALTEFLIRARYELPNSSQWFTERWCQRCSGAESWSQWFSLPPYDVKKPMGRLASTYVQHLFFRRSLAFSQGLIG